MKSSATTFEPLFILYRRSLRVKLARLFEPHLNLTDHTLKKYITKGRSSKPNAIREAVKNVLAEFVR